MTPRPRSYHRQLFPAEIISHAVWLYHVFSLSLYDVELILAERGVYGTLLVAARLGVPLLQPVNVCSNESLARLDAAMIVIHLTRARQRRFVHSIIG